MKTSSRVAGAAAAVAAATLVAFAPVLRNGFVNYDDNVNLYKNAAVASGVSLANLRWAFWNTEFPNWHPLTWISHQIDFQLFGMNAGGHHAVSLLVHAANAVLLLLLLRALTGSLWRSAAVAALFALHPLRVESVAWAAERKDVLSLLFGLLALGAWLGWARRRSRGAWAAALALFAAALMAKPMLVTFPALLLLLDLWPLGRWPARPRPGLPPAGLLLEKLPFLALAAGSAVVTFFFQRSVGAVAYAIEYPLAHRIPNAFRSFAAYLGLTAWPAKLAVFYPYFWEDVPWWQPALGALLVVAISLAALLLLRRRPALFTGWAWYLGTLLPVIGIVQAGSQSMADRYTYLPQIGVLIALVWVAGDAVGRRPRLRAAAAGALLAALAALGALTWVQSTHWRSTETLFRHAIAVTENNFIAYSNLGTALSEAGRTVEGNAYISKAFQINPSYRAEVHGRSGDAYAKRGMRREAAEQYRKALAIVPWDRLVRSKLEALGDDAGAPPPVAPVEAVADPRASAGAAGAAWERGNRAAGAGRGEEAVAAYREAVRLDPGHADAWQNLGVALAQLGRLDEATAALEEALRIRPEHETARRNLAAVRGMRGR